MIISISFPQPLQILMRKSSWTCKQSKSSDNNSQLPFYFIVYLQNKSFTRKVFDLSDINTGMCCGSVLGVPETPLYAWSWMALLIFWWLQVRSVKQLNHPRPGLGMLKKNVWKMVVLLMLCAIQVFRETSLSPVESILFSRPNTWYSSTCSNPSNCFEWFCLIL